MENPLLKILKDLLKAISAQGPEPSPDDIKMLNRLYDEKWASEGLEKANGDVEYAKAYALLNFFLISMSVPGHPAYERMTESLKDESENGLKNFLQALIPCIGATMFSFGNDPRVRAARDRMISALEKAHTESIVKDNKIIPNENSNEKS